jgi:hypothetical protein
MKRRPARPTVKGAAALAGFAAAIALANPAAGAATARDCSGVGGVSQDMTTGDAGVRGQAKRLYFVHGGAEMPSCPDASPACRSPSYVIAGDIVLTGRTLGPYTCALAVDVHGRRTEGWLPTADLQPFPPLAIADWYGFWVAPPDNRRITIQHVDDKRVVITAELYGVVISGEIEPQGDRVEFAIGPEGKPIPVAAAAEKACRLRLRTVGAYLLVEAGDTCGYGAFGGVYLRS